MIKSPKQWAETFANLADTDDMVVTVSFRTDQIRELKNMFLILESSVSLDDVKEVIDKFEAY